MALIQVLSDSIGPRLVGTPNSSRARRIKGVYAKWGISARSERWYLGGMAAARGDASRIWKLRGLEHGGHLLVESGTKGSPCRARRKFWLTARLGRVCRLAAPGQGKYVLASPPQPVCRPDSSYLRWPGRQPSRPEPERAAIRTGLAGPLRYFGQRAGGCSPSDSRMPAHSASSPRSGPVAGASRGSSRPAPGWFLPWG
jgi:hypothetical protein